jgi:hypothetical protein
MYFNVINLLEENRIVTYQHTGQHSTQYAVEKM